MGLWIERYKENEEIRVVVEKMLFSNRDYEHCHPDCIALITYRECILFGFLKYDHINGLTCRKKKCKKFFGNKINIR